MESKYRNGLMKIHLLLHFDGGNRGCEGIAKGTATLLDFPHEMMIAYSRDPDGDSRLGMGSFFSLRDISLSVVKKIVRKIFSLFLKEREKQKRMFYNLCYLPSLRKIRKGDVFLSTGGDMLCYDDNEVIYTNEYLHNKGVRTILWGCSMGPENLTPLKLKTLKNFSAIYARESLSYNFFLELGLKNVFLFPDPAFALDSAQCVLPNCFATNDVIGINVSKFILKGNSLETSEAKKIVELMDYIIQKTNLYVLLVPHVLWNDQDDRVISQLIMQRYANSKRISVLQSETLNYCQLRYVISKCKYFIGARTHAVISAYSMCVPTLALGYSIKSKGIAKDLGLPSELVVELSAKDGSSTLLNSFQYLQANEASVKTILQNGIADYKRKLVDVKSTFFQ